MTIRTVRIIFQIVILFVFVLILLETRYTGESDEPATPFSDIFLKISPLNVISSALSSYNFTLITFQAIVILVATLILGRIFCGWICPLGTTIDISRKILVRKSHCRQDTDFLRRFKRTKYYILIVLLISCAFAINFSGLFDPISIITRFFVNVVFPAITAVLNFFTDMFIRSSSEETRTFGEKFNSFYRPYFSTSAATTVFFTAFIFVLIVCLEYITNRFWCRYLCPLGALFGVCSRFRILKNVSEKCSDCSICSQVCKTSAIDSKNNMSTSNSECIICGRCVSKCPQDLKYAVSLPNKISIQNSAVNLSRRGFLVSSLSGVFTAVISSVNYDDRTTQKYLLRPPGVKIEDEDKFLSKCIRCAECVRVCSTSGGGLKLVGFENGWFNLWTPIFKYRSGCCEYNCNLCGKVCPTDAIPKLSLEEKQKFKIGVAVIDRGICWPWSENEACITCQEMCPVPDKAIQIKTEVVQMLDGSDEIEIQRPYVDETLCIGCGVCEKNCPVVGDSAIRVTRFSEEVI